MKRRGAGILVLLALVSTSLVSFLFAGWASSRTDLPGLDWRRFDQQSALLALSAVAQLVLAYMVWFQIRAANEATTAARGEARVAEDALRARDRELEALAILEFVGQASTASALLQMAYPALRDVMHTNGSTESVASARVALQAAEVQRQAAYASSFRITGLLGETAEAYVAAREFMDAVDQQAEVGRRVVTYAGVPNRIAHFSSWPDPKDIRRSTKDERDRCVEAARAVRSGNQSRAPGMAVLSGEVPPVPPQGAQSCR
jgi:hypothetical protein